MRQGTEEQNSQNPPTATTTTPQRINAMTLPGLVVGLLAVVITCVMVCYAELVVGKIQIGFLQLPPVVVGMLVLLLGMQGLLKRFSKRLQLAPHEMFTVYTMMLLAAMVSSRGLLQKLIPLMVVPNYYATPENGWKDKFFKSIPSWAVPWDPNGAAKQDVTKHFYEHLPPGAHIPWQLWIVPLLAWGVFVALMFTAFLCLAVILRRQWVDNEKLSFPLAQLPLEIAGDADGSSFFKSRLLWAGVAVPVLVFGMKALHLVQPTIPDVTLQWWLADFVSQPPWNIAAQQVGFIISFAAIGFFFLLPTDILFSIWFFFLLTRLEVAVGTSYNIDLPGMPQFPPPLFVGYQAMGAYFVLAAAFLYSARVHLRMVWAAALGRRAADGTVIDDSDEFLPYRVAVWGLLASIGGAALWLWWAGMSPWLAVMELGIGIFVIGVVMARSTAEAGMLMTETTFRPINVYQLFAPMHTLGHQNLTLLVFFDSLFLRDQRGLLLCGFLDSARIAGGTRVKRRSFAGALVLGIVVAFAVAVFFNVTLPYHIGALKMDSWMEQGNSRYTFDDTSAFATTTAPISGAAWQRPTFFGVGVIVTIVLTAMRALFFWWPLHPLGYALAGSWSTVQFWFPCFIAWMLKSLCMRYGGAGAYIKVRPLFLGLVLGEFGMAVLAVILYLLFRLPAPAFPWG